MTIFPKHVLAVFLSLLPTLAGRNLQSLWPPSKDEAVSNVDVRDAILFDALVALREGNMNRVLFGFEDDQSSDKGSFALQDGTVQLMMSELRQRYTHYDFKLLPEGVIAVRPANRYAGSSVLDIRIAHFEVHGHRTVADVVQHLAVEVPELRDVVYPGARSKIGASTAGGMEPDIDFIAENMTVRDLLNRLSIYSVRLSIDTQKRGRQLAPVSWRYRFRTDTTATNTLGGYPEFSVF